MRIGFVGAGAIAEHHLGVLSGQPGVEIAAVCDLDERLAAEVAQRHGAAAFTDWEAMLASDALDALFVCTPPAHHAAPAIAAFERGLAVYLEKPLARSLADGEAIAAAWQRSGVVCAVGYQWRSLDVVLHLRSLLRGSQPGMLVSRSFGPTEGARHDLEGGASWFTDPAASGGVLFELASHDIDLQIALAGPVESVQATAQSGLLALAGRAAPGALDDAVSVLLRFAGGGIGACHVAWSTEQTPPLYALDAQSADAALQLVLDPAFELRGRAHGEDVSVLGTVRPRVSTVTWFLEAARSGDPARVACSPADALATLRALLAAERAIRSGERVHV
ncbi:MAG TPA: Gfo/Idh/MocA family oxidoreductase [Gaiellales bacterium]|nr:Gfo/Idh/MocA family oxidoreductase [Gaiellales bacterium]